jgi:hypothetical protein
LYFKDSFTLKEILDETNSPPGTKIFSCDAKSMYTNIAMGPALEVVETYIHNRCEPAFANALMEALKIVMENNSEILSGDKLPVLLWAYHRSTPMGNPLLCNP